MLSLQCNPYNLTISQIILCADPAIHPCKQQTDSFPLSMLGVWLLWMLGPPANSDCISNHIRFILYSVFYSATRLIYNMKLKEGNRRTLSRMSTHVRLQLVFTDSEWISQVNTWQV